MSTPSRQVTSLTNPLVKAVRALHQGKTRDETGQFVAEGLKFILEALELGKFPEILLHGPEAAGRLYSTSLATMILEVYYRHLPIYGQQSVDEEFKE